MRYWMQIILLAVCVIVIASCSRPKPVSSALPAEPKSHDAELAILRQHDQKQYNASAEVMAAATRVFEKVEFVGKSESQIATLLGAPAEKKGSEWTYLYHNGEQGVMRRIHFDTDKMCSRVESIMTQ